ncbi:MAG: hypothetical protein B7Z67_07810 [Acidiphilium sp. 21-60-14]|nr:MAG: hypothetical protein B7Z67_07810 [Acidiphilium sp. 21-60-14]OYV90317.1 MAG: hypothetical protein B7Z57_09085 [Acidiphilium sp. 37-60-79]
MVVPDPIDAMDAVSPNIWCAAGERRSRPAARALVETGKSENPEPSVSGKRCSLMPRRVDNIEPQQRGIGFVLVLVLVKTKWQRREAFDQTVRGVGGRALLLPKFARHHLWGSKQTVKQIHLVTILSFCNDAPRQDSLSWND